MNILLIGQVSLHWGRMEFGNIGNYYIIEPFIREIHRVFSNCNIRTTFQMSDDFCRREKVEVLPLNYYYDWQKGYLALAKQELEIAKEFKKSGAIIETTPFIDEVFKADLVIDFSGDIWGDNANLLGENRFLIGLIKDRVAQLLGKPTALIAGSPGPFNDSQTIEFAKEVFTNFNLVTNREPLSEEVLKKYGFNVKKVKNLACPAFLFESGKKENIPELFDKIKSIKKDRPVAGFVICGWNFPNGPFDKWPRPESDYLIFAEVVEFMTNELGLEVCLLSHSNGFKVPPEKFELIQGRDFPIAKQLYEILKKRGRSKNFFLLEEILPPHDTKTFIGFLDILITGRIHAAVAALSQAVPTVIIDYGHEPKAHKLKGFAKVAMVENFVVEPTSFEGIREGIKGCWQSRDLIKVQLKGRMKEIIVLAKSNFELLKSL